MEAPLTNNPEPRGRPAMSFAHAHAHTRELEIEPVSQASHQAFQILRGAFTVAPVVAGIDKFTHLLVDWDQYLPPVVNRLAQGHGHELMLVVGVIEIVAGIGVLLRPRIFSYVVAAWLALIIVNLLLIPGYYDVALRDFGLLLAALALGRLSADHDRS
jgi:hypothetical protein